jgi:hypothetical protein
MKRTALVIYHTDDMESVLRIHRVFPASTSAHASSGRGRRANILCLQCIGSALRPGRASRAATFVATGTQA